MAADYPQGSFISAFLSSGPKSYAYRVTTPQGPKEVVKIKGITLNSASGITLSVLDDLIDKTRNGQKDAFIVAEQLQFSRNVADQTITH